MNDEGFLFLGKAETQLARSPLFSAVEMKHRIFAKVAQGWRRPLGGGLASARRQRGDAPVPSVLLLEAVVNEAGTALVVVDETGALALANTPARQLLGVGEADIGRPFQDLPISYRPLELRGPIEEVFRTRRSVRLEDQEHHVSQGETVRLSIDVRPLIRPDGSVYSILLAFTDTTRLFLLRQELEAAQENLENTIEELQSANEELETTNEELQSINEELETTNEELQSTNEELETLNEEARSSNDEMESVNEELRIQAEQASSYRIHLESVLRSMNGGIIVLDDKRVIQGWNRWSENMWGLRIEEVVGTAFDALDIGLPVHLLREAMAAVQSGQEEQLDRTLEGIDRRGRRIVCKVIVSELLDEAHDGQGTVLLFQDVTHEHRRDEEGRYLGRVMGRAHSEIFVLDPATLQFKLANDGAQRKLGYDEQQLTGMALPDVLAGVRGNDMKALLAPLLSGAVPELVFETTMRGAGERTYPAEICVQYLADEHPPILIAMAHETSDRRKLGGG